MTSMSRLRSGNVPSRCTSTNLGFATSGSAATTAGLKRSVCPAPSGTPRRSAASMSRSASATEEASGFSTSVATPRSMKGSATATCDSVGTAMLTASTRSITADASVNARPPHLAAISSARMFVYVDDANEIDAVHGRQQPRVMLPEMSDANDGDTQ